MSLRRGTGAILAALMLVIIAGIGVAREHTTANKVEGTPTATLEPGAFPCGYGTRCDALRPTCTPGTPCSAAWPQAVIPTSTPQPYPTCPPQALCALRPGKTGRPGRGA